MQSTISRSILATKGMVRQSMPRMAVGTQSLRFKTYSMSDRERALENRFFSKEDEILLRKILSKVKSQAEEGTPESKHADIEDAALREIVGKYNVSDMDIQALKAWRHSADF